MKTLLASLVLVAMPAAALADPIVPIVGSPGAGWRAMGPAVNPHAVTPGDAPTTTRDQHYWAGYSYDRSDPTSGSTACGAGALIMGHPCTWALDNHSGTILPVDPAQAGEMLYYWGLPPGSGSSPNFNADADFYFSGDVHLDLKVLSEMTSWKDGVEIGWYGKDDPNDTHILVGGPAGIPKDSHGNYDLGGTTVVHLSGDFGFYYKNHVNGTAFYTQSALNHIFAPLGLTPYLSRFGVAMDDEFPVAMFDPRLYQQWALFGQGDRFWLGLEDIFGPTTPCPVGLPCSDYDFNDFIVGGRVNNVPEPTNLTLLAAGLFGVALALKRRSSAVS